MANMDCQINLALVHGATFFSVLFPLEAVSRSKKSLVPAVPIMSLEGFLSTGSLWTEKDLSSGGSSSAQGRILSIYSPRISPWTWSDMPAKSVSSRHFLMLRYP